MGRLDFVIRDQCKNSGDCADDDCCANYDCLRGKVVFVAGQKCNAKGGGEDPHCTDETVCHDYLQVCYYKRPS